eukprot:1294036-Pleurochrysis_carterae.AAC.3
MARVATILKIVHGVNRKLQRIQREFLVAVLVVGLGLVRPRRQWPSAIARTYNTSTQAVSVSFIQNETVNI